MTQRLYCDEGCRESWKCDRRHGLIYPPFAVDDPADFPGLRVSRYGGGWLASHVAYTRWARLCRYCQRDVRTKRT